MAALYIWTLIQGIIFLYVQILIVPSMEILNVIPNILLPWMIYTVWKKPFVLGVVSSFVIALLYDVSYPMFFGMQSLIFMILVIFIDLFRIPFEEKSIVARILTLGLVNLIYTLISYLIFGIKDGFDLALSIVSVTGFIYNLVISFAIFWLMIFLAKLRIIFVHE